MIKQKHNMYSTKHNYTQNPADSMKFKTIKIIEIEL